MARLNWTKPLRQLGLTCLALSAVVAAASPNASQGGEPRNPQGYDLDMALCVEPAFAQFVPGVPIQYQVTVTNLGEDVLFDVSIGDWHNTLCTNTYPSLEPGQSETYECTYTPHEPRLLRLSTRGRAVDSELHWAYTEVYSVIGLDLIFGSGFEP